ncbi:2-keto-3-deoxy-galactonokinase [Dyella solisilvae]|uniref:2-keto-3-deoxy-galactonokinase n=1 Tax=Dyella solisilvae TaxID=1920168 RepID=A0A370K7W2_9GAMM|nr:2-dehydro-3-deoxygalactonokinase [Dyella solisilvae]RDI98739.1 2-keto-3-deoxy-galactonokinase [Dyella solisilvae]
MTTALIAIDWGSTHLRSYRLGQRGEVQEVRALPWGVRQLPDHGFDGAFSEAVEGWPDAPVIACGMVGSRNGWLEVPYVDTPASVAQLASALAALDTRHGRRLYLVPGVRDPSRPDVMRGEETQVAGLLATYADAPGSTDILLPGTHSKWVSVRHGRMTRVATVMTGELYGMLCRHSVLGAALPPSVADDEAFDQGLLAARDSGAAGALSRVFLARSLMLDGKLAPASVPSYLSGLLIGEELRAALAAGWIAPRASLHIVGEDALVERYVRAATVFGLQLLAAPSDTTARGLWRLAALASLVPPGVEA